MSKGPPFDQVIRATVKDLKAANRVAGREIVKVGRKAIVAKAPKVGGKKLGVKTKTNVYVDRAEVAFMARTVGGWMMHERGTKAHDIHPRKGRRGRSNRPAALRFAGLYAADAFHPGTSGSKAWTKAVDRLKRVIDPAVADVYDDALGV